MKHFSSSAAFLVAICFSIQVSAQTYTEKTGTSNPFNLVDVSGYSVPSFVDIDGDGDLDAFVGQSNSLMLFYRNIGTKKSPSFVYVDGLANPLYTYVILRSSPVFVDIDNDGDQDAFAGGSNNFNLYRNTGTATAPVFTAETNPVSASSGNRSTFKPNFVDIDNDGDKDLFLGYFDFGVTDRSIVLFYQNTGTAANPVFTLQSSGNPLAGISEGFNQYDSYAFSDADGDNDLDLFIGSGNAPIAFYRNTGSVTTPSFLKQSPAANPFGSVSFGPYASPAFADIDNDGDMDAFFGNEEGTIRYAINNTINLPLTLIAFTAVGDEQSNMLSWQTTDEFNTKDFILETAIDGINFKSVANIAAAGHGANKYSYADYRSFSGTIFYRLKMNDLDGKFTYSKIIRIESNNNRSISIYPNPVVNRLTLRIADGHLQNTDVQILDPGGKLHYSTRIRTAEQPLDVQFLPKGLYIIRFADGVSRSFVKD